MAKPLTTHLFGFLVVLVLSLFHLINGQNSSLILVFIASLAMVSPKRDFQQFPMFSSLKSPIFTHLFLPLDPELVKDSSTSVTSSNDLSSVLSPAHDPPVLDPVAPPSPEPPIGPNLHRYSRVSIPLTYLIDYHCSFTLATLYEPHTYREAHSNPLWQQAMSKVLDALHKNHT